MPPSHHPLEQSVVQENAFFESASWRSHVRVELQKLEFVDFSDLVCDAC